MDFICISCLSITHFKPVVISRMEVADVSEPDNGYVFPLDRDGSDGESQKLLDDEDNLLSRGMGSFILHQTLG